MQVQSQLIIINRKIISPSRKRMMKETQKSEREVEKWISNEEIQENKNSPQMINLCQQLYESQIFQSLGQNTLNNGYKEVSLASKVKKAIKICNSELRTKIYKIFQEEKKLNKKCHRNKQLCEILENALDLFEKQIQFNFPTATDLDQPKFYSENAISQLNCSLMSSQSSPSLNSYISKKTSHWTNQENQIYINYLKQFSEQFQNGHRKKYNVFKQLSKRLGGSRTNHQCRGHHKKMMQNYHTIQLIIKNIQMKMQNNQERQQALLQKKIGKQQSQQYQTISKQIARKAQEESYALLFNQNYLDDSFINP